MIFFHLFNLIISDCLSMFITFLISTIIFIFLKNFWHQRWLYYHSFNMDGPTPTWPIVGNALYARGGTADILAILIKLFAQFKSPVRLWAGYKLLIGISRPEHIEIVLNKALEKQEDYKFLKCILGEGLLAAPVPLWRQHRKIIAPLFNQKILNGFVEIFGEQAEILVGQAESYHGKGIFNADKLLNNCSTDIVCECLLDYKIHAQTTNQRLEHDINRVVEIGFQRTFQIWLHPDFVFNLTSTKREFDQCMNRINQFLHKVIKQKRLELKQFNQLESLDELRKHQIFLDYIIKQNWTDEEISDEALTLLVGGIDSGTATDGFVLMMLGMHPDIQDRVYGELEDIFGTSNRRVTAEDLRQMHYLERVIKETLRLFPGAPFIARAINEDIKLGIDNYVLPKGSSCLIGIYRLHMNPEIWLDPKRFEPDRFLPEEIAKRHPYSYLPFSGGPRDCIGRRFGMMAMKSVISTLLRRYKIKTPYKRPDDIKLQQNILLKAVDGCLIELESRN